MRTSDLTRRVALGAVATLCLCSWGCASAPSTYGSHARYSPAFHGYVMSEQSGSDDPDRNATVLLLRDPLTGDKLRCQEQVEAFRELHEDLATDYAHDENVGIGVAVSTGAVFGTMLAFSPVGGLVLAEAMLTADTLYDDLSSDDAVELLAHGIALFKRKRYGPSTLVIERALAKDAAVGITDKAYFYLGMGYDKLGKKGRARKALELFVDRAGVRDVDAYREARASLRTLGVSETPCAADGPVELHW